MLEQIQSEACRGGAPDVLPPYVVDLIRERQRRLAAIPRYDRYIAQAAGHLTMQGFWRDLKRRDVEDARRLKDWLDREVAERARKAMDRHEPSP